MTGTMTPQAELGTKLSLLGLNQGLIQPVILAGDPDGSPTDSPENRVDPNTTDSPFAGVGSLRISVPGVGDFLGSGAAISRRHILTAAHVLDVVNEDGVVDPVPKNVLFHLNFGGNLTQIIPASELQIYPGFQGISNTTDNDLAIVTLSSDLPEGVPIYSLYREPIASGSTITMVGYGTSGNGVTGFVEDTAGFDIKRVGQNQVDLLLEGNFVFDFDGPDASTNLFSLLGSGPSLGNDIEASLGPGDSGGPSFIQQNGNWLLAGVNTFAFGYPEGFGLPGSGQGTFGTGGGGVLLSDPDKLAWIDSIIGSVTGTGSLQGVVWQDDDGEGDRDPDESGLAGWTVYLDLNQNQVLDPGEPTQITDTAGNYEFTELATGTYTVAAVLPLAWQQTFPTEGTRELLNVDFSAADGSASLEGFTIDNTGAATLGLWHLSTGRGEQTGHSADDSLYFGTGEGATGGGNYNVGHTAGRVTSAAIDLRGLATAELSFNYFLNVEPGTTSDLPRVKLVQADGSFQTIASKSTGLQSVPSSTLTWSAATIDLTGYVGNTVQIQFEFDTVDNQFNNLEGWYIDDVVVRGVANRTHKVTVGNGDTLTELNFGFRPTQPGIISVPTKEEAISTTVRQRFVGDAGNDRLIGHQSGRLVGKAGNDWLEGKAGDDILIGGEGSDTLTGGAGSDRFVYHTLADRRDVITDFEVNADVIDLRRWKDAIVPGFNLAESLKLVQVGSGVAFRIDTNGTATPRGFRTLVVLEQLAVTELTAANILI